jgi:hypothetical protein
VIIYPSTAFRLQLGTFVFVFHARFVSRLEEDYHVVRTRPLDANSYLTLKNVRYGKGLAKLIEETLLVAEMWSGCP